MIFQPAIIALLLAASLSLAMLATASPFAVQLVRHWQIGSGNERQLRLDSRFLGAHQVDARVPALHVRQYRVLQRFSYRGKGSKS